MALGLKAMTLRDGELYSLIKTLGKYTLTKSFDNYYSMLLLHISGLPAALFALSFLFSYQVSSDEDYFDDFVILRAAGALLVGLRAWRCVAGSWCTIISQLQGSGSCELSGI